MGIEPTWPAWKAGTLPLSYARVAILTLNTHQQVQVGEAGFEPAKAEPPDLQSGPFDHSGIPPNFTRRTSPWHSTLATTRQARSSLFSRGGAPETSGHQPDPGELAVGFEPTTSGLQNRSSAVELR